MALLVVPRLGTNSSKVGVQYVFGLGDALSLIACFSFGRGVSGETCLTLPFRRRFAIAKSRRIVRIESEKSGKCHSIIVYS